MGMNVAQKLIQSHLAEGGMTPADEIGLKIDQTLTQDATGTLVITDRQHRHAGCAGTGRQPGRT